MTVADIKHQIKHFTNMVKRSDKDCHKKHYQKKVSYYERMLKRYETNKQE